MAEYTYECEECGQQITFSEPRETPFYKSHSRLDDDWDERLLEINEETFIAHLVDCAGMCYRVWKPTAIIIKE